MPQGVVTGLYQVIQRKPTCGSPSSCGRRVHGFCFCSDEGSYGSCSRRSARRVGGCIENVPKDLHSRICLLFRNRLIEGFDLAVCEF